MTYKTISEDRLEASRRVINMAMSKYDKFYVTRADEEDMPLVIAELSTEFEARVLAAACNDRLEAIGKGGSAIYEVRTLEQTKVSDLF